MPPLNRRREEEAKPPLERRREEEAKPPLNRVEKEGCRTLPPLKIEDF